VLVGGGGKFTPKSFDLPKILETFPKICVKMAPNLAWLQNMAPKVRRKSHEPFLEITPKSLHDLRGIEFVDTSCTKNFSWKFGEIRTKILRHTKNSLNPKPIAKRHLRPRCSPFERIEEWMPLPWFHLPASLCILIYTHSLYSLL